MNVSGTSSSRIHSKSPVSEMDSPINRVSDEFILAIFSRLGSQLTAIPVLCKRWNRLLLENFYNALYAQKKPFGPQEWEQHYKMTPVGVPRIPLLKLVEFDPERGVLTLIVRNYKPMQDEATNTVCWLDLGNLFCCSPVINSRDAKSYKFTAVTQKHYIDSNGQYRINDQNLAQGNYWCAMQFPKITNKALIVNTIVRKPRGSFNKIDERLPNLFAAIVTCVTHHTLTGEYSFKGNGQEDGLIIVKEFETSRHGLNHPPYKLGLGFTNKGFCVHPVQDFRGNVAIFRLPNCEIYEFPKVSKKNLLRKSH